MQDPPQSAFREVAQPASEGSAVQYHPRDRQAHLCIPDLAPKDVVEIAKAEDLMPTTVGRLLRLARLAPDIIEQLMQGCQPRRLTLLWLMRNDIPALWPEQRQMLERFR